MQLRFSLIRIVAVALLLYSLGLLWVSYSRIQSAEQTVSGLSEKVSELETDRAALTEKIAAVKSGEGLEQLARERLGYVLPGEKVFYFRTEKDK